MSGKQEFFRQCELSLNYGQGFNICIKTQVSWLPEKFAVKDKYLELKNENGEWENGWKVTEVYARFEAAKVHERSQDYKHTRKASDV